MSGMKRWSILLVTAAAMMAVGGCKTTVVNREVPQPDHTVAQPDHHDDDHRDDHREPPPPDHR